jgi:hypothetical protein
MNHALYHKTAEVWMIFCQLKPLEAAITQQNSFMLKLILGHFLKIFQKTSSNLSKLGWFSSSKQHQTANQNLIFCQMKSAVAAKNHRKLILKNHLLAIFPKSVQSFQRD